jgi:hypothetical protein
MDLIDHIDLEFLELCCHGVLTKVQEHYANNDIDIHNLNDRYFRLSCYAGKLEIAKWIYSFGEVNIHAEDDYAFRWSCTRGNLDVIEWLQTLCDDYYVVLVGDMVIEYKIKNTMVELIEKKEYDKIFGKLGIQMKEDIDDTCGICLDNKIVKPITTNCNHTFCADCILEWKYIYKKDKCPFCNGQLLK